MDDSRITNVTQLKAFLKGSQQIDLSLREGSIEEKYTFIIETMKAAQIQKMYGLRVNCKT
jgi:hypothetical protein